MLQTAFEMAGAVRRQGSTAGAAGSGLSILQQLDGAQVGQYLQLWTQWCDHSRDTAWRA